jgi:hypothetical protein
LGCLRCLVAMWLWSGTLLGVPYALRTSGVAFRFVLERLSNPAATNGGTLTRGAHVAFSGCGFGIARC